MNSKANTSNSNNTQQSNTSKKFKVPPLVIKKNRILSDQDEIDSSSPNSDNEFRSPHKTFKDRESTNKNKFFSTPNRYSLLEKMDTNQEETPTNTNTIPSDNQNENLNNHDTQPSTTDNTPKIPPLFVINISQFTQFRQEITETIQNNNFIITAKSNKIKINVEKIDDFRSLTKFLDEKKYEYYTYRLKDEKDISAVIRNLPMSITEVEVMEELKNLKYPVQSVTRLTNKDKVPTPLMAIQLSNLPTSPDIFKLTKLLNCIIITEPRRKSRDPPQCTNCQRYGHIHKSCKLQSRCVKCNGSHHYSECTKISETPPNCVNCNGTHPANYKGCTYFKNIKNKKTSNTQKITSTENKPSTKINANNPSTKTSNLTYAEITKEKSNPNQTIQNNADSVFTAFLNENLQKTITQFIENIFHNIQTIISSIFNSITSNISIPIINEHN